MLTERDLMVSFDVDNGFLKVSLPPFDCLGISAENLGINPSSLSSELETAISGYGAPRIEDYSVEEGIFIFDKRLQDDIDTWDETLRQILLSEAHDSFHKRIDLLLSFLPKVFMYGVEAGRREVFAQKG